MDLKDLLAAPSWAWPESASKTIQRVLLNKNAPTDDRLAAAELGGDPVVMDDKMAEILLGVVQAGDEKEEVRAQAAISLGPVLEYGFTYEFEDPDEDPIDEQTFHRLQEGLHKLYLDSNVSTKVRRSVLEAAVRAPLDWQVAAIREAYASGASEWQLSAVFAMGYVRGFDREILESLASEEPDIHCEAVKAAGNWGVDGAWSHVLALIRDKHTPKPLLLAAIGAIAGIRPEEAVDLLIDFADSTDDEIAEAADEALSLAEGELNLDEDSEDEEEEGEEEEGEEEEG